MICKILFTYHKYVKSEIFGCTRINPCENSSKKRCFKINLRKSFQISRTQNAKFVRPKIYPNKVHVFFISNPLFRLNPQLLRIIHDFNPWVAQWVAQAQLSKNISRNAFLWPTPCACSPPKNFITVINKGVQIKCV